MSEQSPSEQWSVSRPVDSSALLVALAVEHGVSPVDVLAGTGLDLVCIHEPGRTITATQELRLVENLVSLVGRPGLGFIAGDRYHFGMHGVWTYALLSSPTVSSAIEIGVRFVDLTFSFFRVWTEPDGERFHLNLDVTPVPSQVREFLLERDLTVALSIGATMLGPWLPVESVELSLPEPKDPVHRAMYTERLGATPTWGGAAVSRVTLPRALLALPMPRGSAEAAAEAERACAELLAQRRQRSGFAGDVRTVLTQGRVTTGQAEVAARLHVSLRTLRRRLADEGTTYRELVQETFGVLAEELLGSGLTVEQVAERLGYADKSSFHRAFKQWRGVSPGTVGRARRSTAEDSVRMVEPRHQ